jgi:hypothetical protein
MQVAPFDFMQAAIAVVRRFGASKRQRAALYREAANRASTFCQEMHFALGCDSLNRKDAENAEEGLEESDSSSGALQDAARCAHGPLTYAVPSVDV